ncbi:MAG: hypothetical protein WCS96_14490 [Victivallales bacterium]
MRKGFLSLRNTVIAFGVIAMLAALTFTVKLIAAEWGGQISAAQTEQLDPALCTGSGSGDCLGTPPCDPAVNPCGCD